jgi:hypothetical protein
MLPTGHAAQFRKQAEEAREHSTNALSPLDKEAWLRIAEEWLKLAISVEGRRRGKLGVFNGVIASVAGYVFGRWKSAVRVEIGFVARGLSI